MGNKPHIIKVWPELIYNLPELINIQISDPAASLILIDFSKCRKIDSTGANLFLLKVARLLGNSKYSSVEIVKPSIPTVADCSHKINLFQHLYGEAKRRSLLSYANKEECFCRPYIVNDSIGKTTVFPIQKIDFELANNRRDAMTPFRLWLHDSLKTYLSSYVISIPQVVTIVLEMLKNTADHTMSFGFFGMTLREFPEANKAIFSFSYGDLGEGIKNHIQRWLPAELKGREGKLGLVEAYYYALQNGLSIGTSGDLNKGIGMSIITDGAHAIGMDLSIYDASSRGVLSQIGSVSHKELRKNFYLAGSDINFAYVAEIEIDRRH